MASISKISLIEKSAQKNFNHVSKPLKISLPLFILTGLGIKLKTQPAHDSFEKQTTNVNSRQIFINDVILGKDKNAETVLKTHDFKQYKKSGIPLEYGRENFVKDLNKELSNLTGEEKQNVLSQYNLRLGNGDIDGIAKLPQNKPVNTLEQNICNKIEKYYNNSTKIKDTQANQIIDKIIKGMPEFTMTVGKEQHGTHIYSVDIHSMEVLQKSLNHPDYEKLSDEGKEILKLAVLMHDFGKNGKVITRGHAKQSAVDAKMVLENYDIDEKIKKRVINQVENHHWFESYNKGIINANGVKEIFKTPEDLQIAKIMAKSDLESISTNFHRYILLPDRFLSQKEFDKVFAEKINKI